MKKKKKKKRIYGHRPRKKKKKKKNENSKYARSGKGGEGIPDMHGKENKWGQGNCNGGKKEKTSSSIRKETPGPAHEYLNGRGEKKGGKKTSAKAGKNPLVIDEVVPRKLLLGGRFPAPFRKKGGRGGHARGGERYFPPSPQSR